MNGRETARFGRAVPTGVGSGNARTPFAAYARLEPLGWHTIGNRGDLQRRTVTTRDVSDLEVMKGDDSKRAIGVNAVYEM